MYFQNEAGKYSKYPYDREDARKSNYFLYTAAEPCDRHDHPSFLRYVETDDCHMCRKLAAVDLRAVLAGSGGVEGDSIRIGGRFPSVRKYDPVELAEWLEILSRPGVKATGEPCKRKGHPGLVDDRGRCVLCAEERLGSPRQLAIAAGESWYDPGKPCPRCGGSCRRRVANGRTECDERGGRPRGETPEAVLMRQSPDMTLERAAARSMSLKVFRTGKACRKGHAGWRYVSSGECLDCRADRQGPTRPGAG